MILMLCKNLEIIGTVDNGVLINAITAFITFVALVCAIYFSWQNSQMLKESRKARLVFAIKLYDKLCYAVEIKNVGYYPAEKIHLKFNDDFLQNCVSNVEHRELYFLMEKRGFSLNGGDCQLLFIDKKSNSKREKLSQTTVKVIGSFYDTYTKKTEDICQEFNGINFLCEPGIATSL